MDGNDSNRSRNQLAPPSAGRGTFGRRNTEDSSDKKESVPLFLTELHLKKDQLVLIPNREQYAKGLFEAVAQLRTTALAVDAMVSHSQFTAFTQ